MIYWAYILLTVALAAGLFGFGGVGSAAAVAAQTLFFVFLSVAVVLVALKVSRDARDDTGQHSARDRRHKSG